jgi:hypothetical protein
MLSLAFRTDGDPQPVSERRPALIAAGSGTSRHARADAKGGGTFDAHGMIGMTFFFSPPLVWPSHQNLAVLLSVGRRFRSTDEATPGNRYPGG